MVACFLQRQKIRARACYPVRVTKSLKPLLTMEKPNRAQTISPKKTRTLRAILTRIKRKSLPVLLNSMRLSKSPKVSPLMKPLLLSSALLQKS